MRERTVCVKKGCGVLWGNGVEIESTEGQGRSVNMNGGGYLGPRDSKYEREMKG